MKYISYVFLSVILMVSLTACSQGEGKGSGGAAPTNKPNSGQNGGNPGSGQSADRGYSLDTLIDLVKQAGAISGEPETLDVKDVGAERGVAYGNVVFLAYDPAVSNAYFEAYNAEQVTLEGVKMKIAAINGPYFLLFRDGNADQKAVDAFRSIGFYY